MEETDLGAEKSVGVGTTLSVAGEGWCVGGGWGDRVGMAGSGGGMLLVAPGEPATDEGEPTAPLSLLSTPPPPLLLPPPLDLRNRKKQYYFKPNSIDNSLFYLLINSYWMNNYLLINKKK